MWELLLEWCADIFGETMRSRLGHLIVACGGILMLGVLLVERWGLFGSLVPALLLAFAVITARDVSRARDALWRTACLGIDQPRQAPAEGFEGRLLAPTAIALYRLAAAVNDVRRGSYMEASDRLPWIERDKLRPEEVQLLEAVRAMISLGLGDMWRAAQQAAGALPTGIDELDVSLGRALLSDAWNAPERLRAIDRAWDRAGVGRDPDQSLARLARLAKVRLDARLLDQIRGPEARNLSDEARALGDEELAAELEARSRARAYR
jgi:hypothetical protein